MSSNERVENNSRDLNKKQKVVKEVKSISIILVCVFIFRSIFFEPFRIPTGSMIPTLMIGDFILVNKFSYGLKVPFSDFSFSDINWDPKYITTKSNPKRGDVIVFKYPKDPSINYIKRVIGLPGDYIEIRNKVVYINESPIMAFEIEGADIMKDMDSKFKNYNLKFYKMKTGMHSHVVQQDRDNYYKVDYEKKLIPKGKYFVMGDNRDFSYDSRYWGFVDHKNIKGKALFVWFSMNFLSEHPFTFRPWRIGTSID